MKPKAVIPSLGIIAQAILSLPFCSGRPHARGHSHDGRFRYVVGNFTASSGSSSNSHSAAATWGLPSDSPRLTVAPGALKDIGDIFINPSIRLPSSETKHSRKTSQIIVNTVASLAATGFHATTNSDIPPQVNPTVTSAPYPTSSVNVMTDAIGKYSYSESLQLAFSNECLLLTKAVTIAPSNSIETRPLAWSSSITRSDSALEISKTILASPGYRARRAHAELHFRNIKRPSLSSEAVSVHENLRLALRADDDDICPKHDKAYFSSESSKTYQVVCDVDYVDNDHPFLLVQSFDECVDACDALNAREKAEKCVAALFVPSRLNGADDCYLKSSIDRASPANLPILGAILVKKAQPPQAAATHSASAVQVDPTSASSGVVVPATSDSAKIPSSKPASWGPEIKYASAKSVIIPAAADAILHGPSRNTPSKQYLDVKSPKLITLDDDMLVVGVNDDISTQYGLSLDTGVLEVNDSSRAFLAPLKNTPHISRDGGRGGYLNGQHLFIFSDTGSYSTTTATVDGDFLGFVSSSVSIDVGMNGLESKPLHLKDGMGQWSDDVGRMRGFAPLTQGEQSYNLAMQGKGQRYAIWPESSFIPLANETALMYAPIVYTNVNHETKKAIFTYTGSTLLSITAGGMGGPIARRTVDRIFDQNEIEWGCSGGIRSWGPSGIGGSDGKVYVFGNMPDGMLLSRTSVDEVANRDSYEYWDGDSWSSKMLNHSSKAFFLSGSPVMDVDIFYSPRHLTFIAVYLTSYANSAFYYRYLMADSAVIPSYAPGGDKSADAVEKMVQHGWSEEQLLYQAPQGLDGHYVYAGGVHQGYYETEDITNGGSKMLLSWTSPTGLDPSTLKSEYEIVTAEIVWA